jgi:hypothetical protein
MTCLHFPIKLTDDDVKVEELISNNEQGKRKGDYIPSTGIYIISTSLLSSLFL